MPSAGKYAKGAKYGKRESRNSVEDQFWVYVESVICKQHFDVVYHCQLQLIMAWANFVQETRGKTNRIFDYLTMQFKLEMAGKID